jgi:hypothetical protein
MKPLVNHYKKIAGERSLGTGSLERHRGVPGIPRSERYAAKPSLGELFEGSIPGERAKRDRMIREGVEKFGHTQRAVTDHLEFHSTYVSRISNER